MLLVFLPAVNLSHLIKHVVTVCSERAGGDICQRAGGDICRYVGSISVALIGCASYFHISDHPPLKIQMIQQNCLHLKADSVTILLHQCEYLNLWSFLRKRGDHLLYTFFYPIKAASDFKKLKALAKRTMVGKKTEPFFPLQ